MLSPFSLSSAKSCATTTGGVLTSFPTTAAQAELLDKQGVNVERLVLVTDGAGVENRIGDRDTDAEKEEEQERELLAARLAGKVVKLTSQQDVGSLCDSVAGLLAFEEGGRHSSGDAADVAESPPAAAAVRAAEPPPMLSDADLSMVGHKL